MDYKPLIIDALEVIRKKEMIDKQPFRARAYATVIKQLTQLEHPVHTMEDLYYIKGMGEKITEKVKEILSTGQLQSAERIKTTHSVDAFEALQHIYGVGPAKVRELLQHGIQSVEQLRMAVKKNPLLLNNKQKVGLQYYEDLVQRIPREEMEIHRASLPHWLPEEMKAWETEIVGSFRRGAITSGDIDVLIRVPPNISSTTAKKLLAAYVEQMKQAGYIEEVLALGEHKCMAICRLEGPLGLKGPSGLKARRLDLLLTSDEEYAYALLYFTGSDQFNVAFRNHALAMCYTLNEHRLAPLTADKPSPPPMKKEDDIFRFLGLRYIPPNQRVNKDQILKRTKPQVGNAYMLQTCKE
jgi:DNA polymerase/3'-5' exonuclease PolX